MYLTRGGSVQGPLTSGPRGWPADDVAWPRDHHLASYRLGQVGGAPARPYKYPLPMEIRTHTTFWRFHLQSAYS
jgi:hypothetical protein